MTVSKSGMLDLVRAFEAPAVAQALGSTPGLADWRDERGRNWLHVCCGTAIAGSADGAAASIATAEALVSAGLDVGAHAFTEGDWRATPLWFAISRGRNLALAEWLLNRGSNPNYCLFAAAYNHDLDAIRLVMRHGANVDDPSAGDTPFLGAIGVSHFEAAEELLKFGADVNRLDAKGLTALHRLLKKSSAVRHLAMLIAHGARGDIPGPDGATAAQIMARKKDPQMRALAQSLVTHG